MAPLDTGSMTGSMLRLVDTTGHRVGPSPSDYDSFGAYLKAVRDHRGETLSELADATRVRGAYLAAIEQGDRSILPSRPFAIGYVRSYAHALGVDGDLAVARFKAEWPEASEPLRNPVGVGHEKNASRPLLYGMVAVVIVGVGLWNVAQRTLVRDAPPAGIPSLAEATPAPAAGPLKIAAPNEAPAESTIPAAYVTPGMDAAVAAAGQTPAAASAAKEPAPAAPIDSTPVFVARGAIHGVAAGPNTVILQARRPLSLIVHGADQTVYFARQIAAGEAFRAPLGRGLTADVSDPAHLDAYIGGRLAPATDVEPMALDKIPAPPPPPVPLGQTTAAQTPTEQTTAAQTPTGRTAQAPVARPAPPAT